MDSSLTCLFINQIVTEPLLFARRMEDVYFSGDIAEKPYLSKIGLECASGTKQVQGREEIL